jgi:Glycosyltransferase sugar-binding region containing DXD motif
MSKIIVSDEFPLFHQLIFSKSKKKCQPSPNMLKISKQVGEQNYKLWNFELVTEFLSQHYGTDVLKAFNTLAAYAHKADLARYCISNYFGGTYLDNSIGKLQEFKSKNYDMVIFRDGNSDRTSWKVANGFYFSKSNNPILIESIQRVLENVHNRYYGHDSHFISGPSLFGQVIAKYGLDLELHIGQQYWLRYRRNKFLLPSGQVVARGKRGGAFMGGESGIAGGNNYNELWKNRNSYGENSPASVKE